MPWYYAVAERYHELQNPTSAEKIRLLGERLRVGPESHVLDIASGRGGPALVLALEFGCRITSVERAEEFVEVARTRTREAGLDALIEIVHADAREFPLEPERYDAGLCLGASFVWAGLTPTLSALGTAVRPGGHVAVGEPYWRSEPLPPDFEREPGEEFVTLAATVARFEGEDLEPVALIDSSLDDWDRYETLHWLAADEWLREHPDVPDAGEIRERAERYRRRYLRWTRELLGWAIVVGRKP
jgi:SAM-dependent methyltransferase